MARSRHCDVCNEWHDLEEPWPQACMEHYRRRDEARGKSAHVMEDIAPYKNVYGEVIGGRKQHRDFLRSRGLIEVGNENVKQEYKAPPSPTEDIRRAIEVHNYRGG